LNAEANQVLRDTILQTAKRFPLGLAVSTIKTCLISAGFKVEDEALTFHIDYLVEKELLKEKPKRHSQAYPIFKLTGDGIDYLESQNL
jgi:hypothetical protein